MVGFTIQMIGCHRGDEARRAKTALTAVMLHHFRLNRMQIAIRLCNAFDRSDGLSLKLGQKQNSSIQRMRARRIRDHHRTSPAIAFVTAFFGSLKSTCIAQPIQQRGRRACLNCDLLPIQKKGSVHEIDLPPYPICPKCAPSMRRRERADVSNGAFCVLARGFVRLTQLKCGKC